MFKLRILAILIFIVTTKGYTQSIPIYTHYIVNPYIYNPAYAGLEGKSTVGLTYRKQWYGVNDAPTTMNFTYHAPLFLGLNFGVNITQDNYGIFKSSSALLSIGYTLGLGYNHYLSVGISGGGNFNMLDYSNLNLNDPAFANVIDQNAYIDGNAGIAYHIGDFNLGVSLPRMFETEALPTDTFNTGTLGLIKNYMITADYMLFFAGDNFAFQPYGLYRSYDGFEPQIEGGGILHIKNMLWVGGAYRQDFGIAGFAGIKVKGLFSFGYSYEIPSVKADNVNKSSHEAHLTVSFGKKNKRSKKHATFLASKRPEKEKKEEVAKKEEPKTEEAPPEKVEEEKTETPTPSNDAIETAAIAAAAVAVATNDNKVVQEKEPEPSPFETTTPPTLEVQPKTETQPISTPREVDPTKEGLKPAVVTKKGNHPFELDRGHYVVLGAFGVFENAVRYSNKAQLDGYNTDYGYNSQKEIFFVVIHYTDDPTKTRERRDELRKISKFSKAWYLLVE